MLGLTRREGGWHSGSRSLSYGKLERQGKHTLLTAVKVALPASNKKETSRHVARQ